MKRGSTDIGVYIHFPFCMRKCNYCSFYSVGYQPDLVRDYMKALREEIFSFWRSFQVLPNSLKVRSIYIGGGTPSLLKPEELYELLSVIRFLFKLGNQVEISLEANPSHLKLNRLRAYRELGVNRLSIGVQTLSEFGLRLLGRDHSVRDTLEGLFSAFEAGFSNVSIDLLICYPYQTLETIYSDLRTLLSFPITHISVYSLEFKEGTKMRRWFGNYQERFRERCEELLNYLFRQLVLKGFRRYEIANFSKPGYECVHNLGYWFYEDWLGFGPSAAGKISFRGEVVRYTRAELDTYLKVFGTPCREHSFLQAVSELVRLSSEQVIQEKLMMGLRLRDGLPLDRFSSDELAKILQALQPMLIEGKLELYQDRLKVADRYFDVASQIIIQVLEFLSKAL